MKPSRIVAILFATAAAILLAARPADQGEEADSNTSDDGRSATQVVLIPVPLPLTGNADQVLKASVSQALASMDVGERRGVMIFEFRARDVSSVGSTDFERALSLARFLASDEFRRVRTVAFVTDTLEGHAVLPVLACEEIVIHPDVQFGAAGRDERSIDATMRAAYQDVAERNRTVPVPIVLGMLDRQLKVVEVQLVGGGTRYVLGDELEALREEAEVWKENTISPAGELLTLTGSEMRVKPGFATQLAIDRKELADVLQLPPNAIRENVVVDQAWRAVQIEIKGRITSRSADEVIRQVRTIERKGRANLLCLTIDSPGGPAAPAMKLVNLLTGLDSNTLRTVAFVDGEARSVAALVALAADETYATEDAVLGGPGDTVIARDELDALLPPVQEMARIQNRDWSLPLGLVDRGLEVYRYTREGTGTQRYFCPEEVATRQDADEWQRGNAIDLQQGLTGLKAQELGLINRCADGFESVLGEFHIEEEVPLAQRSSVVSAIERLAGQTWFARTLLFIAFFALISEASAPGIGVAGFASGLCFLLFFWCQFLNGTAGWLELLLFAGGLTCIALEIFVIPGFGVFGAGGGVMVLVSIVLASQTFIIPRNSYQFEQLPHSVMTMAVACGGMMAAMWIMRKFLAESWLFRRLMLTPPSEELELDRLESMVDWEHLMGKMGVTTTQLTPSGKARFGDDVVNVISDGMVVPKSTEVRVVEVRGNRVLVEPAEES